MADIQDMGQALGWDDEIEVKGGDFEPVPDGDYTFEVTSIDRGYFNGSDKMAPCPKAKVQVRLIDAERQAVLSENLLLNSKLSWKIAKFFVSVGLRDKNAGSETKLKMQWTRAIGLRGRCRVGSHEHKGKTYNDIVEWLEPDDAAPSAPQAYVPPQNAIPAPPNVQAMVNGAVQQAQQRAAQQMTPGEF